MGSDPKILKAFLDLRHHGSRTAWSTSFGSSLFPGGAKAGRRAQQAYLSAEADAVRGLEELCVDLVGLLDDGGNRILVLWGGDGQQGQHGQRDVVLAVAETTLIVAVGIQAADRGPR